MNHFKLIVLLAVATIFSCTKEDVVARFKADATENIEGKIIKFSDNSTGEPTTWSWTFEGGTPAVSTKQNPEVIYDGTGVFQATLKVTNEHSQDSIAKIGFIKINPDLSKGLVAYYPFDGDARDASGNLNDGILDGPLLGEDRFESQDSCYVFDGQNDAIDVQISANLNLGNEFTISAWINPKEIKSQTIFRKGGGIATPYSLSLSGINDVVFSTKTSTEGFKALYSEGYSIDTWFLVTGVVKGNQMRLYINGQIEESENISGTIEQENSPFIIGTRSQQVSNTFNGSIDDIRLYNRPFSDFDVKYLYNYK